MWRYQIVELPRGDVEARDAALWELGRAGWELVQSLPGRWSDGSDSAHVTFVFKRSATDDIGI